MIFLDWVAWFKNNSDKKIYVFLERLEYIKEIYLEFVVSSSLLLASKLQL